MPPTPKLDGRGFVLAAPASNSGKTLLSLGLGAALSRRGLSVQYFKCGPDFIDPTLHRLVSGRVSRNLDLRMCGSAYVRQCFADHADADTVIVEGVMGLFDGGEASTASLAKTLALPVVLVVDAAACAESIAALVHGFESFDPGLSVAGVIFNRVAGESHYRFLAESVRQHCRAAVLGWVPRHDDFVVAGRHLGLHMDHDDPLSPGRLARIASILENHIDFDQLLAKAAHLAPASGGAVVAAPSVRARIGIARDAAFCFYYEDNLDLLRAAGAELIPFSPLADSRLPADIDGLYLGGGYPELHAETLADNLRLREEIRARAEDGLPVYGECGGFMYLCDALVTTAGTEHPMVGLYPVKTRMRQRLARLGYRRARVERGDLWPTGAVLAGHEFHYSEADPMPERIERAFRLEDGRQEGFQIHNAVAGYLHLHLGATPEAAGHFVEFCRTHGQGRAHVVVS
ncbi:MAG: cobyrinate a,c-diamide synthase [Thermodesulfobacteriota bacterium]